MNNSTTYLYIAAPLVAAASIICPPVLSAYILIAALAYEAKKNKA